MPVSIGDDSGAGALLALLSTIITDSGSTAKGTIVRPTTLACWQKMVTGASKRRYAIFFILIEKPRHAQADGVLMYLTEID